MPGVVVLESMWNKKGRLLDDEPSVLPYLKAIKQSLAWEGIRVNLVYRRFYSSYDLGALGEERGPVEPRGRRPRDAGGGGHAIGDERALPHVGPGPAARHQLVVGQGHGRAVDPKLPRQLAAGRQLHARREQPLADQPLEVELDLAGQ